MFEPTLSYVDTYMFIIVQKTKNKKVRYRNCFSQAHAQKCFFLKKNLFWERNYLHTKNISL